MGKTSKYSAGGETPSSLAMKIRSMEVCVKIKWIAILHCSINMPIMYCCATDA